MRPCNKMAEFFKHVFLLVILLLVVGPVFFDLGALRRVQYLLLPTYYLNGIYDSGYLLGMAAYGAGSLAVYWLLGLLKKE